MMTLVIVVGMSARIPRGTDIRYDAKRSALSQRKIRVRQVAVLIGSFLKRAAHEAYSRSKRTSNIHRRPLSASCGSTLRARLGYAAKEQRLRGYGILKRDKALDRPGQYLVATVSQTFPRAHRLSTPARFKAVYDARVRDTRGPLVFYALPNDLPHWRMGLSVSRKVGTAPQRNRIKRLLREAYRSLRQHLPAGYDLVIVVRPHEPLALTEYQAAFSTAAGKLHARLATPTAEDSPAAVGMNHALVTDPSRAVISSDARPFFGRALPLHADVQSICTRRARQIRRMERRLENAEAARTVSSVWGKRLRPCVTEGIVA